MPIVHFPGEISVERKGISHWWRNTCDTSALLLSADLLRKERCDKHVM
jgi:hypothetical protein